jgi:hypothetical protein
MGGLLILPVLLKSSEHQWLKSIAYLALEYAQSSSTPERTFTRNTLASAVLGYDGCIKAYN